MLIFQQHVRTVAILILTSYLWKLEVCIACNFWSQCNEGILRDVTKRYATRWSNYVPLRIRDMEWMYQVNIRQKVLTVQDLKKIIQQRESRRNASPEGCSRGYWIEQINKHWGLPYLPRRLPKAPSLLFGEVHFEVSNYLPAKGNWWFQGTTRFP